MSFDLNVTFAGICLVVPDPTDGRVYGLMPPAAPGGGHAHEDHLARLIYRAGHARVGGNGSGENPLRVPLEGRVLDLTTAVSGAGSGTAPIVAPAELFSMGAIMNRGLDRGLLEGDGKGRLTSRVAVGPGRFTDCERGAVWRIGGSEPRHMATSVTWTVPAIEADRLEARLKPISGSGAEETLELHPLDLGNGPSIDLYVFHTMHYDQPSSLPPRLPADVQQPDRGDRASHFEYFYDLFGHPPVPVYEGPGDSVKGREAPLGLRPICASATAAFE